MKNIFPKILVTLLLNAALLTLYSCHIEPVYYSKEEVLDYATDVFGGEIEHIDTLEYPDNSDEENLMYEYVFLDKNGLDFSVYTYTSHVWFDASESIFYDKNINDDYIESMAEHKHNAITAVLNAHLIDYMLYPSDIYLYLTDHNEMQNAAEAIDKIDNILQLEYDYVSSGRHSYSSFIFSIKLKPDLKHLDTDNWQEDWRYTVSEIRLSNKSDMRLEAEQVFNEMEREFVYNVRSDSEQYYDLPDELLYKYPSEYVTLVGQNFVVGGEEEGFIYSLSYDPDDDLYWIDTLDPCQESIKEYNYFDKGAFKHLVEAVGGEYSSFDKTAWWTIGDDSYEATLTLGDNSYFVDFEVYKNGEKLELSEDLDDKGNGTVSGRAFTAQDLELMLGIDININNYAATAEATALHKTGKPIN